MDLPKRKPIRLPAYDYSSPGAYFVTICTHDRRCLLSRITVGADALGGPSLQLTDTGKIVEQYILSTDRMPGFRLDKYVVMPNHIHMILRIDNGPGHRLGVGPYGFGCGRCVETACQSEFGQEHLAAFFSRACDPQ